MRVGSAESPDLCDRQRMVILFASTVLAPYAVEYVGKCCGFIRHANSEVLRVHQTCQFGDVCQDVHLCAGHAAW
jgi:hypothetical protein